MPDPKQEKRKIRRKQLRVTGGRQADLFGAPGRAPGRPEVRAKVGFQDPDPDELSLGRESLTAYLRRSDMAWVVLMRRFLQTQDWSEFEARYPLTGRSPYAPKVMVGLVLYGTMRGTSSTRGLEGLARLDLGAMYLTGGVCPDHSSIGRFLQRHADTLSTTFFEDLTGRVLRTLGSSAALVGIDGTVIEAASSRFKTMSLDNAREMAEEAKREAAADPQDADAVTASEKADRVLAAAEGRAEAKRRNGSKGTVQVSPSDPEAVVQKGKDGRHTPAFVASIASNEAGVIVGQDVHPSNEAASVGPLLDQVSAVTENNLGTVVVDGNYATSAVAEAAVSRDVDLLANKARGVSPVPDSRFGKADFPYDSETDTYGCPSGQVLTKVGQARDKRRGEIKARYRATPEVCGACPLSARCLSKGRRTRVITRSSGEDSRDALLLASSHPNARAKLSRRGSIAELPFASIKEQQRFRRFRRRGLAGARLDFSLQCCAHNLRRLISDFRAAVAASGQQLSGSQRLRGGTRPFYDPISATSLNPLSKHHPWRSLAALLFRARWRPSTLPAS